MGALTHNGLALSHDEVRHLEKVYGFSKGYDKALVEEMRLSYEASLARHAEAIQTYRDWKKSPHPRTPGYMKEPGKPPQEPDYEGAVKLSKAGAFRNLMRFAETDGLRVMAVLAPFLETEQDPLQLVAYLLGEAGFDTAGLEEFYKD